MTRTKPHCRRRSGCYPGALRRGRAALSSRQPKSTRRRDSAFWFENRGRNYQPALPSVSAVGSRAARAIVTLDSAKATEPPVKVTIETKRISTRTTNALPATQFATPSSGVSVIRVDDRRGDDQQLQDGSGRARAGDEEVLIVAHPATNLSGTGGLGASPCRPEGVTTERDRERH